MNDVGQALNWYKASARKGDAEAQYAVARAYELGEGCRKNVRLALLWYRKAAEGGNKAAARILKELQC